MKLYNFSGRRITSCAGLFLVFSAALLFAGRPLIKIEEPDFDFGSIYRGEKAEHTFIVRNDGTDTLRIQNVRSSCGCTVPTLAKRNLAPGESTQLTAIFDSGRFIGSVTKQIYVYSNDMETPIINLSIHTDVKVDLEVRPGTIYFAGLHEGEKVERSILIKNTSDKPVDIKEISSTVSAVRLELPKIKLQPGETGELKLVIDAVKKDMKLTGELTIFNTSQQPEVKVNLYGGMIN